MKRPTDEELLAFDGSNYADYDEAKARDALSREPEAFRAQLLAAMWIDGWKERLVEHEESRHRMSDEGDTFAEGVKYALGNLVAHLRQGDLLPMGALINDEFGWPDQELDTTGDREG
jgi:hypothetical protein